MVTVLFYPILKGSNKKALPEQKARLFIDNERKKMILLGNHQVLCLYSFAHIVNECKIIITVQPE
jgi:hypothetical protein